MKKLLYTALTVLILSTTATASYSQPITPAGYVTLHGHMMTEFHDSLIFFDSSTGKLWMDGGNYVRRLVNQFPTGYHPGAYATNNNIFCFDIRTSSVTSNQVWITDGTLAGTTMM